MDLRLSLRVTSCVVSGVLNDEALDLMKWLQVTKSDMLGLKESTDDVGGTNEIHDVPSDSLIDIKNLCIPQ